MTGVAIDTRGLGELQIITRARLEAAFDRRAILEAVRASFIDQYEGRFVQAKPVHLTFSGGDCHVKSGFLAGDETFLIKIATGFYGNGRYGLQNSNGLMLLLSQETGCPVALLQDEGMLTAWRTVAATVIAAQAACPAGPLSVGIVGTGLQAALTAEWLMAECDVAELRIWGRSAARAATVAAEVGARAESDIETLCRASNMIFTLTPSTDPLVLADWVAPGTHIVGVGADTPGKVEIEPALLAKAATIITDDHWQCLDHGDFGAAVRAGAVTADADIPLGRLLAEARSGRVSAADISFADLTGLSAQDAAIAGVFLARLGM